MHSNEIAQTTVIQRLKSCTISIRGRVKVNGLVPALGLVRALLRYRLEFTRYTY
jgi:hypothetical protein